MPLLNCEWVPARAIRVKCGRSPAKRTLDADGRSVRSGRLNAAGCSIQPWKLNAMNNAVFAAAVGVALPWFVKGTDFDGPRVMEQACVSSLRCGGSVICGIHGEQRMWSFLWGKRRSQQMLLLAREIDKALMGSASTLAVHKSKLSPQQVTAFQSEIAGLVSVQTGCAYGRREDRKSTRLNSSHGKLSRMPSSA